MTLQEARHSVDEETQLMDRNWETTQKKAFTAWSNMQLRKVGASITDCTVDFRDGSKLALLLEVISGEKLPKPDRGKLRVHTVNNVNKCLTFVANKGVKLIGIGSEEIVDGNVKMTLGMIWTIILRFAIQDLGEGMSAKDGLLLWCQRRTKPYKNVNVTNFTTSWRNGLALNALIHSFNPDLMNYDELQAENAHQNLENGMKLAEENYDIPRMLDPEDMMQPIPDEKSVMTYIACFYGAFSKSREAEVAAQKLSRTLEQMRKVEEMTNEYEDLSSKLLDFIRETKPQLDSREVVDDSTEGFDRLNKDYNDYKSNTVPKWAEEKNRVQACLNSLQTLLRVNNKPPYIPPESLRIDIINDEWKNLEGSGRERLVWIKANLLRHRDMDQLRKKFDYKCSIYDYFLASAMKVDEDKMNSLEYSVVSALNRKYQPYCFEVQSKNKRLTSVEDIYNKLVSLNYSKIDECSEHLNRIKSVLSELLTESEQTAQKLQENVDKAKELDDLRADFALKADKFSNLVGDTLEDIDNAYTVNSVEDVDKLQAELQEFKKTCEPFEAQLADLAQLNEKILSIDQGPNPYTNITCDKISIDLEKLKTLNATKEQTLQEDMVKQKYNAELVAQLTSLSSEVGLWHAQEKEKVSNVRGTLEEQKNMLSDYDKEVSAYYSEKNVAVRDIVQKINEARANTDDSYVLSIESGFKELQGMILAGLTAIESQILIRDSSKLTEEQMAEYTKLFQELDKQNLGYLGKDDFRNFLIALGYKVTPGEKECDEEFDRIYSKCDVESKEHVTLSNYLSYVAEEMKEEDSADEMIEAFKTISEGKPFITPLQLKRELPDHAERLIQRMEPYTGEGAPSDALNYLTYTATVYGSGDL